MKIQREELSLFHELKFSNFYNSAMWWCKHLLYFKHRLFDLTEFIVWNIYGLQHLVEKKKELENKSSWQRLNSCVVEGSGWEWIELGGGILRKVNGREGKN